MRVLVAALTIWLAAQGSTYRRVLFFAPINDDYRVRGTVTYPESAPGSRKTALSIELVDRRDASRYWRLAEIDDEDEFTYGFLRADERSLVISRLDPDGKGSGYGSIKLFFDVRSKRLIKRLEFETAQEIVFPSIAHSQTALGVTADGLVTLQTRQMFSPEPDTWRDPALPQALRQLLPLFEFEGLTLPPPDRDESGYNNGVGPHQAVGDRFWFGTSFYAGEGGWGIGAVGSVTATGEFQMLRIPQLFEWSVSALLVEPETIWAGRVSEGEYGDNSGGLLEYNRRTSHVRIHEVPDVIHRITVVEGAVFLGTAHGLYIFRNGEWHRFRMEPDINDQMIVVVERLR